MVDVDEMHRLQAEAARPLLEVVRGGGFASVELFWSEVAGSSTATLTALDPSGAATQVKTPNAVFDALEDLRAAMAEPGKGTWFSVIVRVAADSQYEFDFNYDRRPYWSSPTHFEPTAGDLVDPNPSDEAFLDDLEEHPRNAEFIPSWHPAAGGGSATSTTHQPVPAGGLDALDGVSLFPAALAGLASNDNWHEIATAIKRQMSAVLAEGVPSDQVVSAAYNRVFDLFLAPRNAAIVKQLWAPASVAAGYPAKSTDIPDDEAVAAPSPALEVLLEDISDVMSTIAEHQLAATV